LGSLKIIGNVTIRYSDYSPFAEVCVFLVAFSKYSEIHVETRKFFLPDLYLAPPFGVAPPSRISPRSLTRENYGP